ncbi:MAG TPA: restriction endonuclease subunit S [Chitinispirillaceae bacterium]|nr:restriction endonuclease subunit S [Chitinispirillaceae bacterium]
MIPEDWEVKALGMISSVSSGGTPNRMNSTYWKGNIPWVTTSLIDFNEITNAEEFITEAGLKNSAAKLLSPGTILLALYGQGKTRGKVGILGIMATTNQACASINLSKTVSHKFVFHYLVNQYDAIRGLSNSGSQDNLNGQIVKSILVPIPPLPEQRAIASALSDVDALLESLDRLIAKKRDIKQAAMQQLLTGKKRLPGFVGEWEETTLGEIGECVIGLTYKPENIVKHGLLVLRSSNIQNGCLSYEDNVYVNVDVPAHLVTRVGDILVCVRNGSRALIGKCAVIDEHAAGLTFGAFMSIYRTKYWQFVAHAFKSDNIQKQIMDNIGATINQITNKDMNAFRLKLPPEDEQLAIAKILSDMDSEISALEKRREKTKSIKQAMMQELLTGKTRLV